MYIQRFNNVFGHGECANMTIERLNAQRVNTVIPAPSTPQQDEVITQIFAPNPVTGIPRSDLGLLLTKDTRPEVSQYIRQSLLSASPSASTLPTADEALEMSPAFGESLDAYVQRIRELSKSKKQ